MPEIRRPSEIPLEERVADAFRRFFPADWEDRFRAWVELRRRPFGGFLNQFFFDQSFQGAVKRGGPQTHFAAGTLQNFLHDAVAMLLLIRQRNEDLKPIRFQRQKRFGRWIPSRFSHREYIY